jgi:MFS family permease
MNLLRQAEMTTSSDRRLAGQYLALLLLAACGGAASGLFFLTTLGVRGALLGLCLAAGVPLINALSRQSLGGSQRPDRRNVWLAAIIAGILGGVAVNLYGAGELPDRGDDFLHWPALTGPQTLVFALLYSLGLHGAYALRWRFKSRKGLWSFLLICVAGWLSAWIRFLAPSGLTLEHAFEGLFFALFSGFPFAAFWAGAVMFCDPAWSFERWQKASGKVKSE